MKSTAIAPSNIAFIKYWGRKDEALRLPENGSISMNLSGLTTTTTVEFSKDLQVDEITIDGMREPEEKATKIFKHLDLIRGIAKTTLKARIVSENTFPRGTGLSSSASGFAALTAAATKALGLDLSEKELSILARLGSGSACRSIPNGFVEWFDGDTSDTSYAVSLYPPDYWDIVDIVCILTEEQKDVSTTEGQKSARTSPFYEVRQQNIQQKTEKLKQAFAVKDFKTFGEITEAEALELHAIMLTSQPSLIYWHPATIEVMKTVKKWRKDGISVYFTMNTGQNIHVICEGSQKEKIASFLQDLTCVRKVILSTASNGTSITTSHLF